LSKFIAIKNLGIFLIMNKLTKARVRRLHFQLAPIVILPLLLTVITGVLYQLADVTGQENRDFLWLLDFHVGKFGVINLEKVYPFLNSAGVLFLSVTGIMIWFQTPRRRQQD
jgi:hypothetical protein